MSIKHILVACALCWAGVAHAQTQAKPNDPPPPAPNQSSKDTVPPATDSSEPTRTGKQEPSSKIPGTSAEPIFVHGALTVPGALPNSQTEPAKWSAENNRLDHLPMAAYAALSLTDEQKAEIRDKLARRTALSSLPPMTVGALVPSSVGMEAELIPEDLAARIPTLSAMAFLGAGPGSVVILNPRQHQVVAVIE